MRAVLSTTSSRTVIVPSSDPARRAPSAVIDPMIRPELPCTRAVHTMSPSTVPSMCRSAEASMSPLIATSAPIIDDAAPPLVPLGRLPATGPLFVGLGALLTNGRAGSAGRGGSGFFENMVVGLQERTRIDGAAMDMDLEVKVRPGRTAGAADSADDRAGIDLLPAAGVPSRHVRIASHHAIAMADLDHLAVTGLGTNESHRALSRRMDRRSDGAAEVEPGVHRRAAMERIAAVPEAR